MGEEYPNIPPHQLAHAAIEASTTPNTGVVSDAVEGVQPDVTPTEVQPPAEVVAATPLVLVPELLTSAATTPEPWDSDKAAAIAPVVAEDFASRLSKISELQTDMKLNGESDETKESVNVLARAIDSTMVNQTSAASELYDSDPTRFAAMKIEEFMPQVRRFEALSKELRGVDVTYSAMERHVAQLEGLFKKDIPMQGSAFMQTFIEIYAKHALMGGTAEMTKKIRVDLESQVANIYVDADNLTVKQLKERIFSFTTSIMERVHSVKETIRRDYDAMLTPSTDQAPTEPMQSKRGILSLVRNPTEPPATTTFDKPA